MSPEIDPSVEAKLDKNSDMIKAFPPVWQSKPASNTISGSFIHKIKDFSKFGKFLATYSTIIIAIIRQLTC
jgi:hypothetical protein